MPDRPTAWPILRAELRAVERLDVPHFTGVTSEPVLLGLDAPLGGDLRTSGCEDMVARIARIARFGDADLVLQREIIRGTLYARAAEPHAVAAFSAAEVGTERVARVEERAPPRQQARPAAPDAFVGGALASPSLLLFH